MKIMHSNGFTLAEVLITLGIIGVVAAMTMPSLIANYNGKKYRTAFKKTVSVLSQAAAMNKANEDFDYSGATGGYGVSVKGVSRNFLIYNIAENNIKGIKYTDTINYFGDEATIGLKKDEYGDSSYSIKQATPQSFNYFATDQIGAYALPDGVWVTFPDCFIPGDCHLAEGQTISKWHAEGACDDGECLSGCGGYIDVNGPKGPNKEVSCTTGTTSFDLDEPCTVSDGSMGDVFPVIFHDSVVEPATNAARAAFLK